MKPPFRVGLVTPIVLALLAVVCFVITLDRSPVAWFDSILYASIARSLQLGHHGIPSMLRDAPVGSDQLPFYGPVFFYLASWLFSGFGVSDVVIRLISLVGAVTIAAAGAALVAVLGGHRERQAWTAALLLLSPELGRGATDGRMDTLAVGLELTALAIFARGARDGRRPLLHGSAAGVLLAAAALTTPRTFPFVAMFFVGAVAVLPFRAERRAWTIQMAGAAAIVAVAVGWWAIAARGGLGAWIEYMAFVGMHEDANVAPVTQSREWAFTPWALVTPLATALLAGLALSRRPGPTARGPADVTRFALLATGLNVAVTLWLFNITLFFSVYIFVPLLAAALACAPEIALTRRAIVVVLAADVAVRTGRYVRLATVWPGTDRLPLARFVESHVPRGSDVFGPPEFYFFAVEGAGSHYELASHDIMAGWARPQTPLDRTRTADRSGLAAPAARYLIWPADQASFPLPDRIACLRRDEVASLDPWPSAGGGGGPARSAMRLVYPRTVLYRLATNSTDRMLRCPGSS